MTKKQPKLKRGDEITIAGIAFGKRFKHGFTTRCKPGNETKMVIVAKMRERKAG